MLRHWQLSMAGCHLGGPRIMDPSLLQRETTSLPRARLRFEPAFNHRNQAFQLYGEDDWIPASAYTNSVSRWAIGLAWLAREHWAPAQYYPSAWREV